MSHPCNMRYKNFQFSTQEICDYVAIKLITDYGYEQRKGMIDIRTDKGTFFANKEKKEGHLDIFGRHGGPFITLVERTGYEGEAESMIDEIINSNEKIKLLNDIDFNELDYLNNDN